MEFERGWAARDGEGNDAASGVSQGRRLERRSGEEVKAEVFSDLRVAEPPRALVQDQPNHQPRKFTYDGTEEVEVEAEQAAAANFASAFFS